jgi:hypothetical protein
MHIAVGCVPFGILHDSGAIAVERDNFLQNIRQQQGLEYFLLPKPYKVLCHASKGGPAVLLNTHRDHCDGIINPGPTLDPVHDPLPGATLKGRNCSKQLSKSSWTIVASEHGKHLPVDTLCLCLLAAAGYRSDFQEFRRLRRGI